MKAYFGALAILVQYADRQQRAQRVLHGLNLPGVEV